MKFKALQILCKAFFKKAMFYHLKITFRNLYRNGIYSVINIVGLAVSLAVAILILLWVNDELNFDRFQKKGKDIYLAMVSFNLAGKDLAWKASSPPLGEYSMNEIPDIVSYCRVLGQSFTTFVYENKETALIQRSFVDSTFFSMFTFKLLAGNPANPFPDRDAVILSRKTAESLFGNYEEAFGKIIREDNRTFHVSGVMENMPANTQLRSDALCTVEKGLEAREEAYSRNWGALGTFTYFLLHPNADFREVSKRITDVHNKNMPEFKMTYTLQPLFKNRFYDEWNQPNSNMQACRLFSLAVLVLLIIACINYINLVTARLSKRNKELFVRKALGAGRWRLFFQSMQESTLLFVISTIVATGLIISLFSLFRDISGKEMELRLFSPETLMVYGITFVAVSVFAGLFPAINLSMYQPAELLGRSAGKRGSGVWLRRMLVTLQFCASIMLVTSSIVLTLQLRFVQQKDLGYLRENVMEIPVRGNMANSRQPIKNDLLQLPGVAGVTFASQSILNAGSAAGWKDSLMLVFIDIDKDFIPTLGMKLADGNNFTNSPADSLHFILNETAIKAIGMKDPVGKPFELGEMKGTIIGVVKDFNFKELHVAIEPLIFIYVGDPKLMYIRLNPGAIQPTIAEIEKIMNGYNPETAFNYKFLDESFERLYRADIRTGKLFNIFAVIAVLVSCLGLFGLVTFTAESKTKEIGIRKILGASISSIVILLLKEFLILVGIAMLIAFPVAYYWLDRMLQDFAYRIDISWWMFALSGMITIVLTLLTVSWKAIRAATANPVKAIKGE